MKNEEILKRFDALTEGFKDISAHAWEVYVHGQFIEGVVAAIFCLISIATLLIIAKYYLASFKNKNGFVYNYFYKNDSALGIVVPLMMLAFFIGSFIGLAFSIIQIFAPEYMALKSIISTVSGDK